MPNVTVRGAPLTKAKRSRRTLKKLNLQNRQRAVRPFDRFVRPASSPHEALRNAGHACPDVPHCVALHAGYLLCGANEAQRSLHPNERLVRRISLIKQGRE